MSSPAEDPAVRSIREQVCITASSHLVDEITATGWPRKKKAAKPYRAEAQGKGARVSHTMTAHSAACENKGRRRLRGDKKWAFTRHRWPGGNVSHTCSADRRKIRAGLQTTRDEGQGSKNVQISMKVRHLNLPTAPPTWETIPVRTESTHTNMQYAAPTSVVCCGLIAASIVLILRWLLRKALCREQLRRGTTGRGVAFRGVTTVRIRALARGLCLGEFACDGVP